MRRLKYIIISVLSLLNIVFIPCFDVWGGLFPGKTDYDFFYAIGVFFTDKDAWDEWVVIFTLSILVPSILMLITAVLNKNILFTLSSVLGLVLWFKNIISFVNQNGFEELFSFKDGSIAIGNWIALTLFIIACIIGLISKKKLNVNQSVNKRDFAVETNNSINQVVIEKGSFCPNCGNKIDKQSVFCGNCGYKF